jgi:predicted RNA-binding Zn ribbon-like protein
VSEAAERAWVLPDEVAPVRLMATIWADTDGVHDDLQGPEDLDAWLDAVGISRAGVHASRADLQRATSLRDAVRRLAAHLTDDSRTAAASATTELDQALDAVNTAAAELPAPRLALRAGHLELATGTAVSPVTAGLADIAERSMHLLGGADAARLRACYAPGCVLYFVKAHPRREWCSIACGNRARAARHYRKIRGRGNDA